MQRIMQNNCAVFRTGEVLEEGAGMMKDAWQKRDDVGVSDRSLIWNSDLVETPELDNLIYQAMVTLESAVNRKAPRGANPRQAFPHPPAAYGLHDTTPGSAEKSHR